MDDLYTFEPMKAGVIDLDNYTKPVSPKMGRRAVSKVPTDNTNIVDQRKSLSSIPQMPNNTDVKSERLIQEANVNAKLAEKRAERAGHVVEAEKFKQEADYYSRLAEKRASRGRATPRDVDEYSNSNNYAGSSFTLSNNNNNSSMSNASSCPPPEKFGFNNKNVERIVKVANTEGETGSYIATYDKLVQETQHEANLERKRAKKQSLSQALPDAPTGDTLDQLKERICLTESRGASPEPHMVTDIPKPQTEQWRPISRGLR
eukprot:TRINITY_DN36746_c0_g1_i1.p1 TRINITY_DN36746_c0_g1~~TRINITY_DN36746_c0_g1_i1.p1  ORF type:complete len:261 (+),score=44.73 TRINITY_DN36746_c0_g1_i1:73-855(+)